MADGAFKAWRLLEPGERMVGASFEAVVQSLSLPPADEKAREAVADALVDLESLGLIEFPYRRHVKVTQQGRKLATARLETAWPAMFDATFVDDEQRSHLETLVRLSEERFPDWVCLREVSGERWLTELGIEWTQENWGIAYEASSSLEAMGLSRDRSAMGGAVRAWPTYAGTVLATRERPTKLRRLVTELMDAWETVEVDFKAQLNLDRESERAEFVRDALALSNTQAGGRRFLVIGFEDAERAFTNPGLAGVSADRLEQILSSWCRRAPRLEYSVVEWDHGHVGLIEFVRESHKVPYLASKGTGKLKVDLVYVRHGRHSVPASSEESADIQAEGDRARNLEGSPTTPAAVLHS